MLSRRLRILSAVLLGLFALIGLWLLPGLTGGTPLVSADPGTLYVASTGTDNNFCSSSQPCHTLQHAVDLAGSGDTIKVAAGQYTGVTSRFNPYEGQVMTQVVYISKTVIIRGGYTGTFSEPPDPDANATIFNAQQLGRVFHIYGNIAPTLEGLRITGGKALTGTYSGGGVYIRLAQVQLTKCHVYGNAATYGGGLWLDNSPSTVSNNTIYSNTADDGGGVYVNQSDGARLMGNTIYTNTAGHYGGGVCTSHSSARLEANTIISNSAAESGGGLCIGGNAPQISGNRIAANYAGYSSGGLYLSQSAARVSGNTIVSNTAAYDGGGLYLSGSQGDLLSNNTIAGNRVSREGGGVFIGGGTATLNWNTIQANQSDSGGGFSMWNSSTSFNGNKVLSNTATYYGGAFYLTSGNVVTMTNMVIADNRIISNESYAQGSGLFIAGSTATLLHTTLARNTGSSGRGLYLTEWGLPTVYSTITLTNTIIVSQAVGVFVDSNSAARLESTLWNGNGANTGGAGTINLANNHTGNPLFALDGYHILTGSAAIDKGVSTNLNIDIDPEPRPYLAPDLGADEYWVPGALHIVYLPLALKTP
jgi:parallel beta-helix repeat protein